MNIYRISPISSKIWRRFSIICKWSCLNHTWKVSNCDTHRLPFCKTLTFLKSRVFLKKNHFQPKDKIKISKALLRIYRTQQYIFKTKQTKNKKNCLFYQLFDTRNIRYVGILFANNIMPQEFSLLVYTWTLIIIEYKLCS